MAASKRRKLFITLGVIFLLLVILRLFLPSIVLNLVNKKLAHLDGYYGHVEDVDIALYRGAYVINRPNIQKLNDNRKDTSEFFKCERVDLSVEWEAIFKGKIVGEVEFQKPVIKYIMNKSVGKKADKDTTDFIELVKDFMPLKINRFAVSDGQIHYIDPTRKPKVDVPLTRIEIEGKGLTNKPKEDVILPAYINMTANLYSGKLSVNVKLDPLKKIPVFDMNGKLTQTDMVNLNNFFKAYGNFDLKKGTMSVYAEFAAKDGRFKGYVKPVIKDMDIVQLNKEEGNVLQIAWEAVIGTTAEVFKNQKKDQLATKVPLEGKFEKPETKTFDAIIYIVKNAFIQAIKPSVDNSVNLSNVKQSEEKKGFFKKLFKKD
jgi:hypothetical protein